MNVTAKLTVDSSQWVAGMRRAEAATKKMAATTQAASRAQAASASATGRSAAIASAASSRTANAAKTAGIAHQTSGLLALAAGTAVVAAAHKSVKAFTDQATAAVKTQRAMGGSVDTASAYSNAAKLAGVDSEAFAKSLTLLDRRLVAANDGGVKTAAMNQMLGTSFTDASGKVKNLSEILPAVADKFKAMKDGPEETALALQLFGRSGAQMLPFLNRGSAGIAELTARARELGVVIDQEGIAKFAAYRKATRENEMAMQGLQVAIGSELTPLMTGLANTTTTVVSAMRSVPGPVKAATVAVLGYAAASALIGPRLGSIAAGFSGAGRAAAGSVRGIAGAAASAKALATGSLAANAATSGLATATGAAGTAAAGSAGGLAAASGGMLAFAAAAAATGMAVSGWVGKTLAAQGTAGTTATAMLAAVPGLNAFALAFGRSQGEIEKFGNSEIPIDQVAESLKKLNAEPQKLQAAWADMQREIDSSQVESAGQRLQELGVNIADVAAAAEAATEEQAALSEEIRKYAALTSQANAVGFKQDMMALRDALKESRGAFNDSKAGLDNQSKALGMAQSAARAYDSEIKQLEEAGTTAGPAVDKLTSAYVRQMQELASVIPQTKAGKQAIDGINQSMANVPGWVPIQVGTPGIEAAQAKISALAAKVSMTPKQLRVAISQAGADPTGAKVTALAKRLGTTPKKVRVLIEAAGADKAIADGGKAGGKIGAAVGQGAKNTKAQVKAAGQQVGQAVADGAQAAKVMVLSQGQQIGQALSQGVIIGIAVSSAGAAAAASAAGAKVAQAYKSAAEVNSPSRITIAVGEALNEGTVVGLKRSQRSAVAQARASSEAVGTAAGEAAARARARAEVIEQRKMDKIVDKLNKQGLSAKQKKKGKSSGRGDIYRAEAEAAKEYWRTVQEQAAESAQKVSEQVEEVRKQMESARETTTLGLTDSGRGDMTSVKSASSAKAWLNSQLRAVMNFDKNLKTIAGRGVPQWLLNQIVAKGLDAAPLAAALAKSNAMDFAQISSTAAALSTASATLGTTGANLTLDRSANAGMVAQQTSPTSFKVYVGDREITDIVGVEVNGQFKNLTNRLVNR